MTIPEQAVQAALDTWQDHEFDGTLDYPRMRNALTAAAPHLAAQKIAPYDNLVERIAWAWASIDGRSNLFDECKSSKAMEDQNGTYEGYMAEARELIKRAALEPSACRAAVLEEAAIFEALEECETYFENRSDADHDETGFVPNEEMRILVSVRAAIRTIASHPVADKPDEAGAQGGVKPVAYLRQEDITRLSEPTTGAISAQISSERTDWLGCTVPVFAALPTPPSSEVA